MPLPLTPRVPCGVSLSPVPFPCPLRKAGPISDCLGARHVVRLASSDHNDKAFYLSAPCKESQLEFFHGLRSALEMSLEKTGGGGGGGEGGGARRPSTTILVTLPPPPKPRSMRWWMT